MRNIDVLPTGVTMNPRDPRTAAFYDQKQTAYVLNKTSEHRTRPTRVMTSHGPLAGMKLNSSLRLFHDQTGEELGEYEVVGIHDFWSGETVGNVLDFKLKHCVVK